MTYDQWKTRAPEDEPGYYSGHYDDEPVDDCDHEDCDTDILTGRSICNRCGHRWWQTVEQMKAEERLVAEYDAWQRKVDRREFWRRFTAPIRWKLYRLLDRVWPRKSCSVLYDEEIPF